MRALSLAGEWLVIITVSILGLMAVVLGIIAAYRGIDAIDYSNYNGFRIVGYRIDQAAEPFWRSVATAFGASVLWLLSGIRSRLGGRVH